MDIGRDWIDRIHKERGFREIGYHYVIRRDGHIEVGRPEHVMGAHTLGHNRDSIGICMAGGVTEHNINIPEDNFTDEQYEALEGLLENLHTVYPEAEFAGHNQFPKHRSRGCPCFDYETFFDILRIKLGINKLYIPMDADEFEIPEGKYSFDINQDGE